mgnify:FL=1
MNLSLTNGVFEIGGLKSQRNLKNLAHVVRHINMIILIDLAKI